MKLVHLVGFIVKKRGLIFLKSKVCVSVANITTAILGQNRDRILSLSLSLGLLYYVVPINSFPISILFFAFVFLFADVL